MGRQIIHKDKNSTQVVINVLIGKQGDYFVAYCPSLELSSYGKTETQAKKNFEVEVDIFLEETEKRGSLEKILYKLGWQIEKHPSRTYTPPRSPIPTHFISQPQMYSETVALPL